jgi:two-component system cell cycle sensor histidine kinase/response regulator CckA
MTTILIVDDEEPVRLFVQRVLSEVGYQTALAADGPQALEKAKQLGKVDLLLTDVMMAPMTGDELARQMRRDDPKLKVLYLTGYSDRLFSEKGVLWADEAFLEKPCSVRSLREAVSLLLSGNLNAGGRAGEAE